MAESGYPGFDTGSWFGLVGPAGLPAPVAQKTEAALAEVLKPEAMKKRQIELGLTPDYGSAAAMRTRIENERRARTSARTEQACADVQQPQRAARGLAI